MYCSQCGSLLRPNSSQCSTCGATLHGGPIAPQGRPIRQADDYDDDDEPEVEIESHLTKAILVAIFCCQPLGIVAIVYAAQVSGLAAGGKIKAARRAAKKADDWANYGLLSWVVLVALYFLFFVAMALLQGGGGRL